MLGWVIGLRFEDLDVEVLGLKFKVKILRLGF
jgi:hypothetical protein